MESTNDNWKQTVVSIPTGNDISLIIHTKSKDGLGFSLIDYVNRDTSSVTLPTKMERG